VVGILVDVQVVFCFVVSRRAVVPIPVVVLAVTFGVVGDLVVGLLGLVVVGGILVNFVVFGTEVMELLVVAFGVVVDG